MGRDEACAHVNIISTCSNGACDARTIANATAQNNLGVILWRSGSLSAALPYLEEAVRLKPDYTDAVVGLASLRAQIAIAAGKP